MSIKMKSVDEANVVFKLTRCAQHLLSDDGEAILDKHLNNNGYTDNNLISVESAKLINSTLVAALRVEFTHSDGSPGCCFIEYDADNPHKYTVEF